MNSGEGQQKGTSALPPAPRGVSSRPVEPAVPNEPPASKSGSVLRRYGLGLGLAIAACAAAGAWSLSGPEAEASSALHAGLGAVEAPSPRVVEPPKAEEPEAPREPEAKEPEAPEPEAPEEPEAVFVEAEAPTKPDAKPKAPTPKPAPKPERRLEPPGPGASHSERVTYARHVVDRIRRTAVAGPYERTVISDESGRATGETRYPDEERTEQPLVLSAIVTPNDDRSAFAVIEHEEAGFVSSYSPGTMLWPGVLPGVWVIDIRPGVVHLLDLSSNSFEFLTFEEPMSPAERRAQERRERARKRRERARKRREARKRKRRRR